VGKGGARVWAGVCGHKHVARLVCAGVSARVGAGVCVGASVLLDRGQGRPWPPLPFPPPALPHPQWYAAVCCTTARPCWWVTCLRVRGHAGRAGPRQGPHLGQLAPKLGGRRAGSMMGTRSHMHGHADRSLVKPPPQPALSWENLKQVPCWKSDRARTGMQAWQIPGKAPTLASSPLIGDLLKQTGPQARTHSP